LQNKREQRNVYFEHSAKILSAVSAGGSEVIAASLDRQFHDSADFTDHSAASLDSIQVISRGHWSFNVSFIEIAHAVHEISW